MMEAGPASRQEECLAEMTARADGRPSLIPASMPEVSRVPRTEFVVITNDDELLEQVGPTLDGESTVRHVETAADAREFLRTGRPSVVLLDVRGLAEPAAAIESLQSPDVACTVVVFAPADHCADVARTIRGSAAFAVLPIPIEQSQAMAVLEGAREETLARQTLLSTPVAPPPVTPVPTPVVDRLPARPAVEPVKATPAADGVHELATVVAGSRSGGGASRLVIPAVIGLALLTAAVAWLTLRESDVADAPPPAPQHAASSEPALVQAPVGTVDELLERARTAMRERRYTDPADDNALHHYTSVLAQEPDNGEAREGLQRISAVLQERATSSLAGQRIDEAARTLEQLRTIRPDDPALTDLESRVAAARAAAALAEDDASRAEQLARLVSARIRADRLLEPAADSAKHHLAQLQRIPGDPQRLAERATTELQQAYLKKLREAVTQGQRAEAERWQAEARALGVGATELAAVQRDAKSRSVVRQAQQESDKLAQLVRQRIDDGSLAEPAGDSALFHLDALKAQDPSSSAIDPIERALSDGLLAQGRAAIVEHRVDRAQASVAAARQLGVDRDGIAALERDIAAARSATAASRAPAPPVELKRTRYAAPEYPKEALQAGLSGEVRVRITVQADGRVKDVVVERATPEKVFDDAALSAARKWRFKPIGKDDSGIEASAVTTIVFKFQDVHSR